MSTHAEIKTGSQRHIGPAASKEFGTMPTLAEGIAGYKRAVGQAVVHRFIEAQGNIGSMARFLAKLFENFDGIRSVSLYNARNSHLEHSITLTRENGRIYPQTSNAHALFDENDPCIRAYRELGIIITDGINGKTYKFDLNPENTRFNELLGPFDGVVHAVFPLYSGSGQRKHGVLSIQGINIQINGSNAQGAVAIQESADALVSIARLVSYIIDSGYDTLTGLPREKQFAIVMDDILANYKEGMNCSFIRFDIDHLKAINDLDGHDAGDMALQRFSEVVFNSLRIEARTDDMIPDILFRLGGGADEFIAVLPGVDVATAAVIADRVRQEVQKHTIVTCSCGVSDLKAMIGENQVETEDGIRRIKNITDEAAYAAKNHGRNTVFSIRVEGAGLVAVRYTQ